MTEGSEMLDYADTTKVVENLAKQTTEISDTTTVAADFENNVTVEFVDGGGRVIIDSVGNRMLDGVKAIRGHGKGSIAQAKGLTVIVDSTAGKREQTNGVRTKRADTIRQISVEPESHKWYEILFMRIGAFVCIAVLIWLLFLFLKRKR